jgi:hypothetical protein
MRHALARRATEHASSRHLAADGAAHAGRRELANSQRKVGGRSFRHCTAVGIDGLGRIVALLRRSPTS